MVVRNKDNVCVHIIVINWNISIKYEGLTSRKKNIKIQLILISASYQNLNFR